MAKRNLGTVEISRAGIEYLGIYTIFGDTITVTLGSKQKITHVGGSAERPEGLARVMLGELVYDHLALGKAE